MSKADQLLGMKDLSAAGQDKLGPCSGISDICRVYGHSIDINLLPINH